MPAWKRIPTCLLRRMMAWNASLPLRVYHRFFCEQCTATPKFIIPYTHFLFGGKGCLGTINWRANLAAFLVLIVLPFSVFDEIMAVSIGLFVIVAIARPLIRGMGRIIRHFQTKKEES